jgi:hypothetical protein
MNRGGLGARSLNIELQKALKKKTAAQTISVRYSRPFSLERP